MSVASRTTVGGVPFETLCRGGVQSYAPNLARIGEETEVEDAEQILYTQLIDTVEELEMADPECRRKIGQIYIGKTYVARLKRQRRFQRFDPNDYSTWKKVGISSRWGDHKSQDYGRDGMVVLGAVTRKTMPRRIRRRVPRVHQEDFALALEQRLLHRCILSRHHDDRVHVVNKTFTAGRPSNYRYIAYAIYMAFSYTDNNTEADTENEDSLQHETANQEEQDILPSSPQPGIDTQPTVIAHNTSISPRETSQHPSPNPTPQADQQNDPYEFTTPSPQSPPLFIRRRRNLSLSLRDRHAQTLLAQSPATSSSNITPHRLFTSEQQVSNITRQHEVHVVDLTNSDDDDDQIR